MLLAQQYRLRPTQWQIHKLDKHIGAARFIYNWALATKKEIWDTTKENIKWQGLSNLLPELKSKPETEWLKEVNAQTLQSAIIHLDKAYTRFFREKKGFPKFKSRFTARKSFEVPQRIEINNTTSMVSIPKIKNIRFFKDRPLLKGKICFATISKSPTNKYYISIIVDDGKTIPVKPNLELTNAIGIDLGIKTFATLSTGEKIDNPKYLRNKLKALKRSQQNVSRKKKGSKNREKSKIKLAIIHEKVKNSRNDFLHKVSTKLTRDTQTGTICMETLSVKDLMSKSHRVLSREIGDAGWGSFINIMKYKCDKYGRNFIQIGRYEPSSKTCTCGKVNNKLKLKDRTWTCEKCGTTHDRDILAANNIRDIAFCKQNLIGKDIPESKPAEMNKTKRKNGKSRKQEPSFSRTPLN